jgi:hypothetical protein
MALWLSQSLPLLLVAAIAYIAVAIVYRLYFAPAARFPGPKLAALTFLYEGYYDVWCEGQYTWKIRELHKQYGIYIALTSHQNPRVVNVADVGPFVRINPYEVHCNDLEFFDSLYVNSAKRRTDKWYWAVRQS